ncbi:MAG: HNH endonuclease [Candidatus Eremiobacteraeota bacterium]|nr:HNH endonuclease [Candidatus Eremiobacteraeota bacterium]
MLGDRTDSWTRRLRDLRDPLHGGYTILTHRDRSTLRPGQYLFPSQERRPPRRGQRISGRVRTEVLYRDGYTCQACGLVRGQRYEDGRRVTVHAHHDVPHAQGGSAEVDECLTLCSRCNEGAADIGPVRQTVEKTLAQVRRLPRHRQQVIFEYLKSVFDE